MVGNKKNRQLVILIALFAVTSLFVYRTPTTASVSKALDLGTVFGPVSGYELVHSSSLESDVAEFLELDDYVLATYHKNGLPITLYIGYYYTLDKVSAAHSPLVCFPGQGWTIDTPVRRQLTVGELVIDYEEMIAGLEGRQELILYWYQAHDDTSPAVYRNKINALINKITGRPQEHAFVRVSVPIGNAALDQIRQAGREFMVAFYPSFLAYINDSGGPVVSIVGPPSSSTR
jgi:EpsI family protein